MARAPSSGPAGAILKLPAPLIKAVLVFGVVGSTLGATLFVASVTGASVVRIPALAGPSYARDVSGFHPINSHSPSPPASTPTPPASTPTPSTTPSHSKSPTPTPTQAPTQTPTPSPSESPPPPPTPSLSVVIATANSSQKRNKPITYTITVTNTGTGAANDLVVESHVPDGSSLDSWMCGGQTVGANGASSFTCGTLGSAPAPDHPLVFAVSALAPGASITEQFTVSVDHSVKHNSAIVDHAHAYAANADLADSNIVSVIVR